MYLQLTHLDIKLENLMLQPAGDESMMLKVVTGMQMRGPRVLWRATLAHLLGCLHSVSFCAQLSDVRLRKDNVRMDSNTLAYT